MIRRPVLCSAVVLGVLGYGLTSAFGGVEVAGELFVDLDATHASAGTAEWENTGSLGNFVKRGDPVVEQVDGVSAVSFNFSNGAKEFENNTQIGEQVGGESYWLEETNPLGLTGNSDRSFEVWVHNTENDYYWEEFIVTTPYLAFREGPFRNGGMFTFSTGTGQGSTATRHLSQLDASWQPEATCGQWSLMTLTYDGFRLQLYLDGEPNRCAFFPEGAIDTNATTGINIGGSFGVAGALIEPGECTEERFAEGSCGRVDSADPQRSFRGSIAKIRIHDGVLTAAQVKANYEADVVALGIPGGRVPPSESLGGVEGSPAYPVEAPREAMFDADRGLYVGGELYIDLDADDLSGSEVGGYFDEWPNRGTHGGSFFALGTPTVDEFDHGVKAAGFNLETDPVNAPDGEVGDAAQQLEPAPAGITRNSDHTVEAWIRQPSINTGRPGREVVYTKMDTVVSWGRHFDGDLDGGGFKGPGGVIVQEGVATRDPVRLLSITGRGVSQAYFGSESSGYVAWRDQQPPTIDEWHHIAWTFWDPDVDGAPGADVLGFPGSPVSRLYKDGLYNDGQGLDSPCVRSKRPLTDDGENLDRGWPIGGERAGHIIDTSPDQPITIAQSLRSDESFQVAVRWQGSHYISRLRIHDRALNAGEIRANYDADKGHFYRSFIPGDCNADTAVDLSDGVAMLNFAFLGADEPVCLDACDFNDSGTIDVTTAVYFFSGLFAGGSAIVGVDQTGFLVSSLLDDTSSGACGMRETRLGCAQATCDIGSLGSSPQPNGGNPSQTPIIWRFPLEDPDRPSLRACGQPE